MITRVLDVAVEGQNIIKLVQTFEIGVVDRL